VLVGLAYRIDPRAVLELEPELVATMIDVLEESAADAG
jgi:hypothetical protein